MAPLCYNSRVEKLQQRSCGLQRADMTNMETSIIIIMLAVCSSFLVAIAEEYEIAFFLL